MRKIVVAFILMLFYCQCVSAEKKYEAIDWGLQSGVAETSNSVDRIPGKNGYYRQTGKKSKRGRKSANYSEYYFPSSGDVNRQLCRLENNPNSNVIMTEYECDENQYLTFSYPSFSAYIEGNSRLFGHSVKVKDVWLNADLEWKVGNSMPSSSSSWKSAMKYVPSVNDLSSHLTRDQYQLNHRYTFPKRSAQLNISSLLNDILRDRSTKRQFDEKGYVDIKFRYVFHIEVQRKTNGNVCGYFCPNSSCYLNLHVTKSEIGELYVDKGSSFNFDKPMANVVIKGQNNKITFRSNGLSNESSLPIYDVISADGVEIERLESMENNVIDLAAICEERNVREGSHISVKRIIGTEHESNSVDFVYLPMPSLVMENSKSRVMTNCSSGDDDPAFSYGTAREAYERTPSSFFKLPCPKCDFGEFADFQNLFDVEYKWRFWSDNDTNKSDLRIGNGRNSIVHAVVAYDIEGDGNNIYIPKPTLSGGHTYYFERVAVLKNFDNTEVACVDLGGEPFVFEVKSYSQLTPDMIKIELNPRNVCYGGDVNAVFSMNKSMNLYGEKYGEINYEIRFGDTIIYTNDGVEWTQNIRSLEKPYVFSVSMNGECGKVMNSDSITPVLLDGFGPGSICVSRDSVSLSLAHDDIKNDDVVYVNAVYGTNIGLCLRDPNTEYDYLISRSSDATDLEPLSTFSAPVTDDTFYLYARQKNGMLCMAEPIEIVMKGLPHVDGGKFEQDTVGVCPNASIQSLPNLTDPYMEGADHYTFLWTYCNEKDGDYYFFRIWDDSLSRYRKMESKDFLPGCDFNMSKPIYVKREVTAWKNGIAIDKSESSVLFVDIYSLPSFKIGVNGKEDNVRVCKGDSIHISTKVLWNEMKIMPESSKYGMLQVINKDSSSYYVIDTLEDHALWGKDYSFKWEGMGTHNAVRMSFEFCGQTKFSDAVDFLSPDVPNLQVEESPCKIVGQMEKISARADNCKCYIIKDTIRSVSSASLLIPTKADFDYQILVTNDDYGCSFLFDRTIPAEDIENRKYPAPLEFDGDTSNLWVCRGVDVVVTTSGNGNGFRNLYWRISNHVNDSFWKYEDGDTLTVQSLSDTMFIQRTSSYYKGNMSCYSIVDTTLLYTWPNIEVPILELSDTILCNGSDLDLTVKGLKGGSSSSYYVELMPNNIRSTKSIKCGEPYTFHVDSLCLRESYFYVTAKDSMCNSYIYRRNSDVYYVEKTEDIHFEIISVSPYCFVPSDFDSDGNSKVWISTDLKMSSVDSIVVVWGGKKTKKYHLPNFSFIVNVTDFDEDGRLPFSITAYAGHERCVYSRDTALMLGSGFNQVPVISCGSYVGGDTIFCCPYDTFIVKMEESVLFNGEPVENMRNYQMKWITQMPQTLLDSARTSVLSSSYKESCCLCIKFVDVNGIPREIYSLPIIFMPKSYKKDAKVSFYGSELTSMDYCYDSQSAIVLSADYDGEMTWQYCSESSNGWQYLPDSFCVAGYTPHDSILRIKASSLNNMLTRFQVEGINECGSSDYSELLSVRFVENSPISSIDLKSSNVFENRNAISDTILMSVNIPAADTCLFIDRNGSPLLSEKDTDYNYWTKLDSVDFGVNSFWAIHGKYVSSGELCLSTPIEVSYNVYETIKTPKIVSSYDGTWMCLGDSTELFFSVDSLRGGSGRYYCYWEYRYLTFGTWRSFMGVNYRGDFEYVDDDDSLIASNSSIKLRNLDVPIAIRVLVQDDQYPGEMRASEEFVINVYPGLKDKGIQKFNDICYGEVIDSIEGSSASGSNDLRYTWFEIDEDGSKSLNEESIGENKTLIFPTPQIMDHKAFYMRVVEDLYCHRKDSSIVKIYPKQNLSLLEREVVYNEVILSGQSVSFMINQYSDYRNIFVLNEEKDTIIEGVGTEKLTTEPLVVPDGEDSLKVTFYLGCEYFGCQSYVDLKLETTVYKREKGKLHCEDMDGKNWICSGGNVGRIISEGGSPDISYIWYRQINDGQLESVLSKNNYLPVTTPGVDLDTTIFQNGKYNTDGLPMTMNFIRMAMFEVGGYTLYLEYDTIKIGVVPTLRSVSKMLFGDDYALAGELMVEGNRAFYCSSECRNPISGHLSDELLDVWTNYQSYMGPGLYDKDDKYGLVSYIEEKNQDGYVIRYDSCNMLQSHYAGEKPFIGKLCYPQALRALVVRVVDDGCSSLSSYGKVYSVQDSPRKFDDVFVVGYCMDDNKQITLKGGLEVGDSLVFCGGDDGYVRYVLFEDKACMDTIKSGYIIRYEENVPAQLPMIYSQGYMSDYDCYGVASSITIPFGLRSDGGLISVSDSVIFISSDSFPEIVNVREASGTYIYPEKKPMEWTYSWEFALSDNLTSWIGLRDVPSSASLSKEFVNSKIVWYLLSGHEHVYFRRVAKNDQGRIRYSNVIKFTCLELSSVVDLVLPTKDSSSSMIVSVSNR